MGIYQTWKPSHPCYLDWQKICEGWPQWEWHRLEWCDIDGEVIGHMASCLHEIISKLRQGLSSKSSKNTADSLPSNRMPAWVISAIFFFQVGLGCNAQRFTSEWRCLGRLLVSFVWWCHGIKPHKKGWKRSCFSMQCNVRCDKGLWGFISKSTSRSVKPSQLEILRAGWMFGDAGLSWLKN